MNFMRPIGSHAGTSSERSSSALKLTRSRSGWCSASILLQHHCLLQKKMHKVCHIVGGVVSPIFSNIYLNQLDHFVETHLIPQYTQGCKRKDNPAYRRIAYQMSVARKKGEYQKAQKLLRLAQQLPSRDPNDPNYRRLRSIRYADDMLLGFAGTRAEAEQIKGQLGSFLQETLKLEFSEEKTLITQARKQAARFLSSDIQAQHRNDKLAQDGYRHLNTQMALRVPKEVGRKKIPAYRHAGKPLRRLSLACRSD